MCLTTSLVVFPLWYRGVEVIGGGDLYSAHARELPGILERGRRPRDRHETRASNFFGQSAMNRLCFNLEKIVEDRCVMKKKIWCEGGVYICAHGLSCHVHQSLDGDGGNE